jgi:hypothetical protein
MAGAPPAAPITTASTTTLPASLFVSAVLVGLALMIVVAGLAYFTVLDRRAGHLAPRALSAKQGVPAASGVMRGSRLQILPGGFGGFSTSGNSESR